MAVPVHNLSWIPHMPSSGIAFTRFSPCRVQPRIKSPVSEDVIIKKSGEWVPRALYTGSGVYGAGEALKSEA